MPHLDETFIDLPASAGTVEGRARVILDMAEADLAPATSWSPHVRQYGLPPPCARNRELVRPRQHPYENGESMSELLVDFITSLDGFGAAEGWPGWWGVEGPEYLGWLDEQPERAYTVLMGANTYQLMSGFAAQFESESDETEEAASFHELTAASKVVVSSTLETPLSWANTRLVNGNAIEAVGAMKREGLSLRTIGSLTLCRSLLNAGLVDRFRVVVFPVITGATGTDRIYDGYPDVALEMVASHTFDGRLQLLEYIPTVLDGPPGTHSSP